MSRKSTDLLPSLLSRLRLLPQETPSIVILLALDPRYIDSGRPQQKTPLPNNSSVIEVCLPCPCREMEILLLFHACSFPMEAVYRNVAQRWDSTLAPLFRLSGVMSQLNKSPERIHSSVRRNLELNICLFILLYFQHPERNSIPAKPEQSCDI
jgi:hypothetical protein